MKTARWDVFLLLGSAWFSPQVEHQYFHHATSKPVLIAWYMGLVSWYMEGKHLDQPQYRKLYGSQRQKPQRRSTLGLLNLNPAASYSSIERLYSTIGAGGLNGRVRDGIGCDTSAIATGNCISSSTVQPLKVQSFQLRFWR